MYDIDLLIQYYNKIKESLGTKIIPQYKAASEQILAFLHARIQSSSIEKKVFAPEKIYHPRKSSMADKVLEQIIQQFVSDSDARESTLLLPAKWGYGYYGGFLISFKQPPNEGSSNARRILEIKYVDCYKSFEYKSMGLNEIKVFPYTANKDDIQQEFRNIYDLIVKNTEEFFTLDTKIIKNTQTVDADDSGFITAQNLLDLVEGEQDFTCPNLEGNVEEAVSKVFELREEFVRVSGDLIEEKKLKKILEKIFENNFNFSFFLEDIESKSPEDFESSHLQEFFKELKDRINRMTKNDATEEIIKFCLATKNHFIELYNFLKISRDISTIENYQFQIDKDQQERNQRKKEPNKLIIQDPAYLQMKKYLDFLIASNKPALKSLAEELDLISILKAEQESDEILGSNVILIEDFLNLEDIISYDEIKTKITECYTKIANKCYVQMPGTNFLDLVIKHWKEVNQSKLGEYENLLLTMVLPIRYQQKNILLEINLDINFGEIIDNWGSVHPTYLKIIFNLDFLGEKNLPLKEDIKKFCDDLGKKLVEKICQKISPENPEINVRANIDYVANRTEGSEFNLLDFYKSKGNYTFNKNLAQNILKEIKLKLILTNAIKQNDIFITDQFNLNIDPQSHDTFADWLQEKLTDYPNKIKNPEKYKGSIIVPTVFNNKNFLIKFDIFNTLDDSDPDKNYSSEIKVTLDYFGNDEEIFKKIFPIIKDKLDAAAIFLLQEYTPNYDPDTDFTKIFYNEIDIFQYESINSVAIEAYSSDYVDLICFQNFNREELHEKYKILLCETWVSDRYSDADLNAVTASTNLNNTLKIIIPWLYKGHYYLITINLRDCYHDNSIDNKAQFTIFDPYGSHNFSMDTFKYFKECFKQFKLDLSVHGMDVAEVSIDYKFHDQQGKFNDFENCGVVTLRCIENEILNTAIENIRYLHDPKSIADIGSSTKDLIPKYQILSSQKLNSYAHYFIIILNKIIDTYSLMGNINQYVYFDDLERTSAQQELERIVKLSMDWIENKYDSLVKENALSDKEREDFQDIFKPVQHLSLLNQAKFIKNFTASILDSVDWNMMISSENHFISLLDSAYKSLIFCARENIDKPSIVNLFSETQEQKGGLRDLFQFIKDYDGSKMAEFEQMLQKPDIIDEKNIAGQNALMAALFYNKVDLAEKLLGISPKSVIYEDLLTKANAVIYATRASIFKKVFDIYIQETTKTPAEIVNSHNYYSGTLFSNLLLAKNLDGIKTLLDFAINKKAPINVRLPGNYNFNWEYLLIDNPNEFDEKFLEEAIKIGIPVNFYNLFIQAIHNHNLQLADYALSKLDLSKEISNINSEVNYRTLLMEACYGSDSQILESLLDKLYALGGFNKEEYVNIVKIVKINIPGYEQAMLEPNQSSGASGGDVFFRAFEPIANETALMFAAKYGNARMIEVLINNDSDLKILNNKGKTALVYAAEAQNYSTFEVLINKFAELSQQGDRKSAELFHNQMQLALSEISKPQEFRHEDKYIKNVMQQGKILEILLNKGVDLFAKDIMSYDFSAGEEGCAIRFMSSADQLSQIAKSNPILIKTLLKFLPQLYDILLREAIDYASYTNIVYLIEECKKYKDISQKGELEQLIQKGLAEIKERHNVNTRSNFYMGNQRATQENTENINLKNVIEYLEKEVLNANFLDELPQQVALPFTPNLQQELYNAFEYNDIEALKNILRGNSSLLNVNNIKGKNLLMCALEAKDYEFARELLEKGINTSMISNEGRDLTCYAVNLSEELESQDFCKMLIERKHININIFLLLAIAFRKIKAVNFALEQGADVNSNPEQKNIFESALRAGNIEIIKIIYDKGVDLNKCNFDILYGLIRQNEDVFKWLMNELSPVQQDDIIISAFSCKDEQVIDWLHSLNLLDLSKDILINEVGSIKYYTTILGLAIKKSSYQIAAKIINMFDDKEQVKSDNYAIDDSGIEKDRQSLIDIVYKKYLDSASWGFTDFGMNKKDLLKIFLKLINKGYTIQDSAIYKKFFSEAKEELVDAFYSNHEEEAMATILNSVDEESQKEIINFISYEATHDKQRKQILLKFITQLPEDQQFLLIHELLTNRDCFQQKFSFYKQLESSNQIKFTHILLGYVEDFYVIKENLGEVKTIIKRLDVSEQVKFILSIIGNLKHFQALTESADGEPDTELLKEFKKYYENNPEVICDSEIMDYINKHLPLAAQKRFAEDDLEGGFETKIAKVDTSGSAGSQEDETSAPFGFDAASEQSDESEFSGEISGSFMNTDG